MSIPERVLRLAGSYYRKEGVSEKDFHEFLSRRHGVECGKLHEKYGLFKYQLAFSTSSTQELARSLKLPNAIDEHDLRIEYYFKDVSTLLAISADEDFKALHVECYPYIRVDNSTVHLSWIEVYLEDGKLANIDSEGTSLQPSFEELSQIQASDKPVNKYY
ncbi:hypothetical protein F5B20DRAFT_497604 [Whalleya microplaca]|nr:hypothetical protein F5B20DRAFT_497604 [Whalleya microplaca]